MRIRPGGPDDIAAVLALGDEAVKWMNARGNTQQWGTAPWTGDQKREAVIRDQAQGGGMRIAEDQDGAVLGAMVITEIPQAYVPPAAERELYINLLLVSRRHSGQGIGAALIERAKQEAAARGIGLIRVDCWAGQDGSLVRVYEKYGFTRVQEFTVALPSGDWPGMLLAMRLAYRRHGMSEARAGDSTGFSERMIHTMNEAALALMVSVGHRTGLFDVMATMPAATSAEIASRASLDERYVREWLAVMTTGRIVEHDGATGSYSLPADHAAWLTRAAGINNLATGMQYIGLLALVEDQIVDCFRHGGGVPYSAFPRFQAVMAEDSGAVHDATLIDVTLPLVPGLIDRLRQGIDVADVGCGSGHAVNLMAEAFPRSRFTGFDFSDAGIAAARLEAERKGVANARFDKRDAARLGEAGRFDFVTTFDAVHDQARPDLVLAGIARALRPGGVYLCVDTSASSKLAENLDHPLGPFLYTVSCMHCMTVSLADGGMGLGTMWGEQTARKMLGEAGFTSVEVAHLDGDMVNTYIIASKG